MAQPDVWRDVVFWPRQRGHGQLAGTRHLCGQWHWRERVAGMPPVVGHAALRHGLVRAGGRLRSTTGGGPGAAANFFDGVAPVAIAGSGATDSRIQLNGYVKGGDWKVGGGWLGRRVSPDAAGLPGVNSDMFYLTASYTWTPQYVIDGGVYRIVNAQHDTRGTIAALRGTWLLS